MDSLNRKSSSMKNDRPQKSNVSDAANELLNESKKLANELYEDGRTKLNEAEQQLKDYSDLMLRKIQEKPLTSILIAGGIGFLLSKLLKK
ncbi:hypothetical protein [Legionella sp. km772]|uniref:hypothetical protein n=1 Tax=Legionella sp. km772 TaxID=2498111 RepID=UPI0018F67B4B|nr:hypothetical protein [Legionella sp. km772]